MERIIVFSNMYNILAFLNFLITNNALDFFFISTFLVIEKILVLIFHSFYIH